LYFHSTNLLLWFYTCTVISTKMRYLKIYIRMSFLLFVCALFFASQTSYDYNILYTATFSMRECNGKLGLKKGSFLWLTAGTKDKNIIILTWHFVLSRLCHSLVLPNGIQYFTIYKFQIFLQKFHLLISKYLSKCPSFFLFLNGLYCHNRGRSHGENPSINLVILLQMWYVPLKITATLP